MSLQTGWVRLKVEPDAAAKQVYAVTSAGPGTPVFMNSEVTAWSCDPDAGIDTILSIVNRNNHPDDDEIVISTVWRRQDGSVINRIDFESYYTVQTLIKASECIVPGVMPPGASSG